MRYQQLDFGQPNISVWQISDQGLLVAMSFTGHDAPGFFNFDKVFRGRCRFSPVDKLQEFRGARLSVKDMIKSGFGVNFSVMDMNGRKKQSSRIGPGKGERHGMNFMRASL